MDGTNAPRGVSGKGRRNLIGLTVGVLALGLLIWAKLQLVAGVPRTAVADPAYPGGAPVAPFEVPTKGK
jgi:hypothetical protein